MELMESLERWILISQVHFDDSDHFRAEFLSREYLSVCKELLSLLEYQVCYDCLSQEIRFDSINIWDLPQNILYEESCRTMILLMFIHSPYFRSQLEAALEFPGQYPLRMAKAQMMFNIINRFIKHLHLKFTVNFTRIGSRLGELKSFQRCFKIVFPTFGKTGDVGKVLADRIPHKALDDKVTVTFNSILILIVLKKYLHKSEEHISQVLRNAALVRQKIKEGETDIWSDTVRPEQFPVL